VERVLDEAGIRETVKPCRVGLVVREQQLVTIAHGRLRGVQMMRPELRMLGDDVIVALLVQSWL
jgi:hypothetical protein